MTSVAYGATEVVKTEYEIVLDKAESLLGFIFNYKDYFGIKNIDTSQVKLYSAIPIYCKNESNEFEQIKNGYPVVNDNGDVVGLIIATKVENEVYLDFVTNYNNLLSEKISEEICIVQNNTGFDLLDGNSVESFCSSTISRSIFENLSGSSLIETKSSTPGSIISPHMSRTQRPYVLEVECMEQSEPTSCWAVSTAVTGNFMVGYRKYTEAQIVNNFAYGDWGAKIFNQVVVYLDNAYDLATTISPMSLRSSKVYRNIGVGKPIITSTYYVYGFHSFVVCGYYDDGTTEYVTYMDPASGTMVTSACIDGLMKYVYNNVNYATYNCIEID